MINKNSTKEEAVEREEAANETLRRYREKILEAVKKKAQTADYSYNFINLIRVLDHDREMVLAAMRENGHDLVSLSDEWRGDREVVLEAVRNCAGALQFASYELRNDREFILAAVKQNRYALSWVSDKMQMEIAQCWANAMQQEVKND